MGRVVLGRVEVMMLVSVLMVGVVRNALVGSGDDVAALLCVRAQRVCDKRYTATIT